MPSSLCRLRYATAVVTVAFLATGCLQPQPPILEYRDLRVSYNSFTIFDLATRFKVSNPNPLPVSGRADYQVIIAGKQLFSGSSNDLDLGARQDGDLYLVNKLDALKLFDSVGSMISAISSGSKELPFEIEGQFSIKPQTGLINLPIAAPINYQGSIPLPELPKIKLIGIKLEDMDFSKIKLNIQTLITNSNNFGIDLQRYSYELFQGGSSIFSGYFDSSVRLPSNQQQQQDFTVEIDLGSVNRELINSISSGTADIRLQESIQAIK